MTTSLKSIGSTSSPGGTFYRFYVSLRLLLSMAGIFNLSVLVYVCCYLHLKDLNRWIYIDPTVFLNSALFECMTRTIFLLLCHGFFVPEVYNVIKHFS